jgi:hypothetical protein
MRNGLCSSKTFAPQDPGLCPIADALVSAADKCKPYWQQLGTPTAKGR